MVTITRPVTPDTHLTPAEQNINKVAENFEPELDQSLHQTPLLLEKGDTDTGLVC